MATNKDWTKWRRQTLAVRGGHRRSAFQETSEALYMTAGYAYEGPEEAEARFKGAPGFTYTRYGNPTTQIFEERMALLEGAPVGRATASGMAALTSILLWGLTTGAHVVAARARFGAIRYVVEEVLMRFGITSTIVDGKDLAAWRAAIRPETKMLLFETPSNPQLEIVDIKKVCEIAHAAGARVVVDNAFASPALQRPMEFGADVVFHSSTKYIDGHGRALGGIILCKEDFLTEHLQVFLRNTGPAISPFNAWLHLKSLETLDMRMREHSRNAMAVADYLGGHKKVSRVLYPFRKDHPQYRLAKAQMSGGGGVACFEINGGKKEAFKVAKAVKLIDVADSALVKKLYPPVAGAASQVGSPQIRHQGTVGGNLNQRPRCWYFRQEEFVCYKKGGNTCFSVTGENQYHAIFGNAGPSKIVHPSSLAVPFVAFGATFRIIGPSGEREVPAAEYFTLPTMATVRRENILAEDELLTHVTLPAPGAVKSGHYEVRFKESRDWPMSFATVVLAMSGGTIASARVVLGAVAPIPWRSQDAERALAGKTLNEATAALAGDAAVLAAKPMSGNAYKIQIARTAVKRAVLNAAGLRTV